MKLVTYQVDQKVKIGIISADGEWVYPMDSIGVEYPTMLEAVKQMCESEKQLLGIQRRSGTRSLPRRSPVRGCAAAGADSCAGAGHYLSGN